MIRIVQFELKKIFSKRLTQLALIAVLLLSAVLAFSTYQNKYAFDNTGKEGTGRAAVEIDKAIAARYAGVLTDEKVQRMISELAPKSGENGLSAVYMYQNTMQSAVSARFIDVDGSWNGLRVSDVFGGEQIKIGYVDGWLGTSQNLTRVLVFLSFLIMAMVAPVFCGEYGAADAILLSSKYGKTKCAAAKGIASVLAALIVTAGVLAANLFMAFVLYGSEGLDCSILFAQWIYTEGGIPFNITCGTLLGYQILLAFTGAVGVAGVTLILSAACKNQMTAFAAAAAAYVLPVLLSTAETSAQFRLIVLLPVYHAQFVSLMSVEQMDNGLLYAIWAIPVAMVFIAVGGVVSHKIFASHSVS